MAWRVALQSLHGDPLTTVVSSQETKSHYIQASFCFFTLYVAVHRHQTTQLQLSSLADDAAARGMDGKIAIPA